MSKLLALADRCERSVRLDRQLDGLIWAAMQGVKLIAFDCSLTNTEKLSWDGELKYPNRLGVAYFTGSIDAAMTLVPDGDPWTLGQNIHHRHWTASINEFGPDQIIIRSRGLSSANTGPLALCAAALRARAAEVQG